MLVHQIVILSGMSNDNHLQQEVEAVDPLHRILRPSMMLVGIAMLR